MNSLKKLGLFCALFIAMNIHAMENNNDDKNDDTIEQLQDQDREYLILGLQTISAGCIAHICKLSPLGKIMAIKFPIFHDERKQYISERNKSHAIETNYRHTAQWKKDLDIKYPHANFNTIDFKENLTNNKRKWKGYQQPKNTIYCPSAALELIDSAYPKKIDGQTLTDDEQQILREAEFCVLHEAGHLKNNDLIVKPFVCGAILIGTESIYQIYTRKFANSIPKKSLPKRFAIGSAIFIGMSTAVLHAASWYAIKTENRADQFAIQQADTQALLGGKQFFQDGLQKKDLSPDFQLASHPPYESRIQAIDDELARRNKKQQN